MTGFRVQRKMCRTCIYRKDSPLDIAVLEAQVADKYGGFAGFRACHHGSGACCRGFWTRHKWKFQAGQIAMRLGLVHFVQEEILDGEVPRGQGRRGKARPDRRKRE